MRFVRVAGSAELPPGGRLAREVEGWRLALFNVEGAVYAIEDRCAHEFAPLHDGSLCGTRLTCRWHGWTYELDPARKGGLPWPHVRRFEVEVREGAIYVGLASDEASGGS